METTTEAKPIYDSHPYHAARAEWEEMVGSLKTRLINAHRIIAAFGIIALVLSVGLVLSRQKQTVVPYVALLDKHGQVIGIATALKANAGQVDGLKVDQLQKWLWNARIVLTEFDAQLALVKDVMRKTTDDSPAKATSYMRSWYEHNSPYERAKTGTVFVEITSILPRSSDTYEMEWTETTHATDGSTPKIENWKGVFRVVLTTPPQSEVAWNPVGFYVVEVNWSRKV